jgi:hypothetical protein
VSNSLSVPRPAQSNLQKLNVSGNRLLTLPPTIALLTALTKLDIKGNEIHELPSEVGELSSVVKIDMSHNMMTKCAPLLYTLIPALCVRWLTTHRVCARVLSSLPWELGSLPKLEVMDISHNPLVIPPPDVLNRGTPAVLAWLRKNEKTVRDTHPSPASHPFVSTTTSQYHHREETSTSQASPSSKQPPTTQLKPITHMVAAWHTDAWYDCLFVVEALFFCRTRCMRSVHTSSFTFFFKTQVGRRQIFVCFNYIFIIAKDK